MNPTPTGLKKIFLVEDDTFLSTILTAKMAEQYLVRSFGSAEQLLTALETETPNLIILDIYLPGMNGLVALEKLRQGSKTAHTPVMVVSNTDQQADRDHTKKFGASFMIKAMTEPGDIVKKVTELLSEQPSV